MADNGKSTTIVREFSFSEGKVHSQKYAEEAHPDGQALGSLYVQKKALAGLSGNQRRLRVTIEAIG